MGWWSDRYINEDHHPFFWKGLRSVKDIFFLGIAMEVKNENGTRFGIDKRYSNVPLGLLFSELVSVTQDPTGLILSHWSDYGWNIKVLYTNQ